MDGDGFERRDQKRIFRKNNNKYYTKGQTTHHENMVRYLQMVFWRLKGSYVRAALTLADDDYQRAYHLLWLKQAEHIRADGTGDQDQPSNAQMPTVQDFQLKKPLTGNKSSTGGSDKGQQCLTTSQTAAESQTVGMQSSAACPEGCGGPIDVEKQPRNSQRQTFQDFQFRKALTGHQLLTGGGDKGQQCLATSQTAAENQTVGMQSSAACPESRGCPIDVEKQPSNPQRPTLQDFQLSTGGGDKSQEGLATSQAAAESQRAQMQTCGTCAKHGGGPVDVEEHLVVYHIRDKASRNSKNDQVVVISDDEESAEPDEFSRRPIPDAQHSKYEEQKESSNSTEDNSKNVMTTDKHEIQGKSAKSATPGSIIVLLDDDVRLDGNLVTAIAKNVSTTDENHQKENSYMETTSAERCNTDNNVRTKLTTCEDLNAKNYVVIIVTQTTTDTNKMGEHMGETVIKFDDRRDGENAVTVAEINEDSANVTDLAQNEITETIISNQNYISNEVLEDRRNRRQKNSSNTNGIIYQDRSDELTPYKSTAVYNSVKDKTVTKITIEENESNKTVTNENSVKLRNCTEKCAVSGIDINQETTTTDKSAIDKTHNQEGSTKEITTNKKSTQRGCLEKSTILSVTTNEDTTARSPLKELTGMLRTNNQDLADVFKETTSMEITANEDTTTKSPPEKKMIIANQQELTDFSKDTPMEIITNESSPSKILTLTPLDKELEGITNTTNDNEHAIQLSASSLDVDSGYIIFITNATNEDPVNLEDNASVDNNIRKHTTGSVTNEIATDSNICEPAQIESANQGRRNISPVNGIRDSVEVHLCNGEDSKDTATNNDVNNLSVDFVVNPITKVKDSCKQNPLTKSDNSPKSGTDIITTDDVGSKGNVSIDNSIVPLTKRGTFLMKEVTNSENVLHHSIPTQKNPLLETAESSDISMIPIDKSLVTQKSPSLESTESPDTSMIPIYESLVTTHQDNKSNNPSHVTPDKVNHKVYLPQKKVTSNVANDSSIKSNLRNIRKHKNEEVGKNGYSAANEKQLISETKQSKLENNIHINPNNQKIVNSDTNRLNYSSTEKSINKNVKECIEGSYKENNALEINLGHEQHRLNSLNDVIDFCIEDENSQFEPSSKNCSSPVLNFDSNTRNSILQTENDRYINKPEGGYTILYKNDMNQAKYNINQENVATVTNTSSLLNLEKAFRTPQTKKRKHSDIFIDLSPNGDDLLSNTYEQITGTNLENIHKKSKVSKSTMDPGIIRNKSLLVRSRHEKPFIDNISNCIYGGNKVSSHIYNAEENSSMETENQTNKSSSCEDYTISENLRNDHALDTNNTKCDRNGLNTKKCLQENMTVIEKDTSMIDNNNEKLSVDYLARNYSNIIAKNPNNNQEANTIHNRNELTLNTFGYNYLNRPEIEINRLDGNESANKTIPEDFLIVKKVRKTNVANSVNLPESQISTMVSDDSSCDSVIGSDYEESTTIYISDDEEIQIAYIDNSVTSDNSNTNVTIIKNDTNFTSNAEDSSSNDENINQITNNAQNRYLPQPTTTTKYIEQRRKPIILRHDRKSASLKFNEATLEVMKVLKCDSIKKPLNLRNSEANFRTTPENRLGRKDISRSERTVLKDSERNTKLDTKDNSNNLIKQPPKVVLTNNPGNVVVDPDKVATVASVDYGTYHTNVMMQDAKSLGSQTENVLKPSEATSQTIEVQQIQQNNMPNVIAWSLNPTALTSQVQTNTTGDLNKSDSFIVIADSDPKSDDTVRTKTINDVLPSDLRFFTSTNIEKSTNQKHPGSSCEDPLLEIDQDKLETKPYGGDVKTNAAAEFSPLSTTTPLFSGGRNGRLTEMKSDESASCMGEDDGHYDEQVAAEQASENCDNEKFDESRRRIGVVIKKHTSNHYKASLLN